MLNNTGGPLINGLVSNNVFTNQRKYAVFNDYNVYCSITNNILLTNCAGGIGLSNYTKANTGALVQVTGNDITSEQIGIFYNLVSSLGTPLTISSNIIRSSNPTNIGMILFSLRVTPPSVSNNTITSGTLYGVLVWNTTNGITITGGNINGASVAAIGLTNYIEYPEVALGNQTASSGGNVIQNPVHSLTLSGVSITNSSVGVQVLDNPLNNNQAKCSLTIKDNTTISTVGSQTAISLLGNDINDVVSSISGSVFTGNNSGVGIDINKGIATINTSRIENFSTGILVRNSGQLSGVTNTFVANNSIYGINYEANAGITQGTVSNNFLAGNSSKAINNSLASSLNATCNWFGTVSPSTAEVSGSVTFTPFLGSGIDTDGSVGFQPIPGICGSIPSISSLTVSSPLGSPICVVQITGVATGSSFVFTGPDGYVFSNVYRNIGTYNIIADGIKKPGIYTLTVDGSVVQTIQVTGTACN